MDDGVAWTLLVLAALAVVTVAVVGWIGQRRRASLLAAQARRPQRGSSAGSAPGTVYACPIHREHVSVDPDAICPVCGQRLAPTGR